MEHTELYDFFHKNFDKTVKFCKSNNIAYKINTYARDHSDATITFMKSSFPNIDIMIYVTEPCVKETVFSECDDAIIEKLKFHFNIGGVNMDIRIRDNILDKAKEIINGERQGQYGKPENSFQRIAEFWSGYLGKNLSDYDVANMMILMKVARNAGGVYKDDNWIDICGYAAIGAELQAACKED